ncbi:hypothetical protein ILYODFUR_037482 [Ilyodon furcidens]|uniref:Uncharacterized protein n=1 Tax=Ilyodon furcidens TaxID=33524 RepID=A0ABV0U239_9TELE
MLSRTVSDTRWRKYGTPVTYELDVSAGSGSVLHGTTVSTCLDSGGKPRDPIKHPDLVGQGVMVQTEWTGRTSHKVSMKDHQNHIKHGSGSIILWVTSSDETKTLVEMAGSESRTQSDRISVGSPEEGCGLKMSRRSSAGRVGRSY